MRLSSTSCFWLPIYAWSCIVGYTGAINLNWMWQRRGSAWKKHAKNMSDLGRVGFEKVKAEASISERTAYGLRCCAKRREALTSFEVGKGTHQDPPQLCEFSGLDDGSGSLVGTHYRTAEIGATAQAIEAHPFSSTFSTFSTCIMRSFGDLWVPRVLHSFSETCWCKTSELHFYHPNWYSHSSAG